jgi:hypothetical protein
MKSIKKLKSKIMKTLEKTKTKVMKKEVDLEKATLDYLQASSKHYFQTRYVWYKEYKNEFYKVFPAVLDDKLHYVAITIKDGKVDVKIKDTSWIKEKKHLGAFKDNVFPQNVKHRSVKPSLEMKIKMNIVKNFIESSTSTETLEADIKKILQ